MATKTLTALVIIVISIVLFPVGIAIIVGVAGVVVGVIGGVFGAIFGMIGGLLGAIFGGIGWFFESLFGWDFFDGCGIFDFNIYTFAALVLIVVLLTRKKNPR